MRCSRCIDFAGDERCVSVFTQSRWTVRGHASTMAPHPTTTYLDVPAGPALIRRCTHMTPVGLSGNERIDETTARSRVGESPGRQLADQLVAATHPLAVLLLTLLDEFSDVSVLAVVGVLEVLVVGLVGLQRVVLDVTRSYTILSVSS